MTDQPNTEPTTEDPPAGADPEDTPDPAEDKDWKAEYEAQVRINKTLERKTKKDLAALEALRKQTETASPPDPTADTDVRRLVEQAERAAMEKANARVLAAEVRAAAAGVLNDPSDALRLLDLSALEVGEDGMIDADEIRYAIADLVKQKPYLAAQGGRRWQGDPDAGARKGQKVSQLTRDDLKRLTPEQIVQAKAEGRLNEVLGITTP